VSMDTAVRAYTQGGAFASFEDHEKGTIAEGKLADLILLDRDLFRIDPMDTFKTKVVLTIFDGKVVYKK
jgi:predicted amidohydrolase YtcJ